MNIRPRLLGTPSRENVFTFLIIAFLDVDMAHVHFYYKSI